MFTHILLAVDGLEASLQTAQRHRPRQIARGGRDRYGFVFSTGSHRRRLGKDGHCLAAKKADACSPRELDYPRRSHVCALSCGRMDRSPRSSCFSLQRIGSGNAPEDHDFLQRVADSIADAAAMLVTGPANEKTELIKHIRQHRPALIEKIVAVETVDRPSDRQLVDHARCHFKADHMMQPRIKQP